MQFGFRRCFFTECPMEKRISMSTIPKVSIIIATFNRAHYLKEAICSVLAQSFQDYEIIVIDDGSTDNTREIAASFKDKIRYIYQKNQGVIKALNAGIAISKGEYVGFLGDDDLWLKDKLAIQVPELDKKPDLGFVCSSAITVDESDKELSLIKKSSNHSDDFESLYENNSVLVLTALVRRSVLDDVGYYDENLQQGCEDYDLWLRISKKYKFKMMDQPTAKYRIHQNNMSKNTDLMLKALVKTLTKKEITQHLSLIKRQKRIANLYYNHAYKFIEEKKYKSAGKCFLQSVLSWPFIGYYYWPKETDGIRITSFYRILRVYWLAFSCYFYKRAKIATQ
jgi:glycosyltransferase involved in cell wall biosynthesis